MRAFALDELGQPGSIHDLPDPKPAEGEVRVRVAAAALNPFDGFVVQGYLKGRMEHRFPLIPASDLAGTVDELGAGVKGFAVGDHVFGITGRMSPLGEGTLAELATATTATLAKRPAALSEVDAAALPLAGVSALMCVEAAAPGAKDVVVVIGASGAIGGYSVQLAAMRGAHVVGVTSTGHIEYVKGLGAADVIDRTAGNVAAELKSKYPGGVASIIDTVNEAPALAPLTEAVRKGGTVVSMRGGAAVDDLAKRDIKGVNVRTEVTTARLDHLAGLAASGKLKAPRVITFALDKAADALKVLGLNGEKLVVKI